MAEKTYTTEEIVCIGDEQRMEDGGGEFNVAKVSRTSKIVETTCRTAVAYSVDWIYSIGATHMSCLSLGPRTGS